MIKRQVKWENHHMQPEDSAEVSLLFPLMGNEPRGAWMQAVLLTF